MRGAGATVVDFPRTFDTGDPERLRRDLERASTGMRDAVSNLKNRFSERPGAGTVITQGTAGVAFGQVTRVAANDDDTEISLHLPKPQRTDGGRTASVLRLNKTGIIIVYGNGANVNGRTRVMLTAEAGITGFFFDGENYYATANVALPWGEGL